MKVSSWVETTAAHLAVRKAASTVETRAVW
jgi:hypothetical protein